MGKYNKQLRSPAADGNTLSQLSLDTLPPPNPPPPNPESQMGPRERRGAVQLEFRSESKSGSGKRLRVFQLARHVANHQGVGSLGSVRD